MKTEITNEYAKSSDFWLATAWIAAGGKYSHAEKEDMRHQVFCFLPVDTVDYNKIKEQYINDELELNFVAVKNANQRLKSEIHSK